MNSRRSADPPWGGPLSLEDASSYANGSLGLYSFLCKGVNQPMWRRLWWRQAQVVVVMVAVAVVKAVKVKVFEGP